MKSIKKTKKILPAVHILGDLKDVKNLISILNKKKTLVIFHDGDQDNFYLEIDGKFNLIRQNDFAQLEKEYKIVLFSFFPGQKKVEPTAEGAPEKSQAETGKKRTKTVKEESAPKKAKKAKKEKAEPESGRAKKKKK
ncbi:MAG: hypothetical protein WCJ26_12985 [bacterium]